MMGLPADLAIGALIDPAALTRLTLPEWDRLLRQARKAEVLARIAALARARGLMDRLPPAPRAHLDAEWQVAAAQHDETCREIERIRLALAGVPGLTTVLLKGAAYLLADAPAALGRTFSDVDILVPYARLPEVEAALMLHGWATTHHSAYDQKYYRLWMHELPPMQHVQRETVIDVHHAILPRTARLKPDSAKLLAAARALPGHPGLAVLAPADMILHSITHLVHNEELSHGLRDLSDIDLLLRHHGRDAGFWDALIVRARELDLARPLHYGLRQAHALLATPVPAPVLAAAAAAAPPPWRNALMDGLWQRALRSPHATTADRLTPLARFALYVRAHSLRMPPLALARHLTIKAFRRSSPEPGA
ncbi:MAG: nucleotidyltransferase family protein [Proteobacteria bacterium]|nr:nucleotidyltransferase family protein [Pseudomonadota bacterium]